MKKFLKRGLSLALALVMVVGLLPLTAFAAVDAQGKPDGVNDKLVLAIYKGTGFPGEPAVYSTTSYQNINSAFEAKRGTFASSAADELDWDKIEPDLLQGKTSGYTTVWGVYDAGGAKNYFRPTASIIQPENEAKIIRAMKDDVADKTDAEVLAKYEIVWYVIKLQHSSGWFGTTEWHVDGVIKEREFFSINYYGNGNTDGNAPAGITNHPSNKDYVVQGPGTLVKEVNGVSMKFLGWSARADGSGAELAFYQEGDTITATELDEKYNGKLSLYAMWDTTTQHTATVNTYLDGVLTSDSTIHKTTRQLALGATGDDGTVYYYDLTEGSAGVYTVQITGNGKFHLFSKSGETYTQIGTHQLTIYNQNARMDVHHYSVTYKSDNTILQTENKAYGEAVTATAAEPTKKGYRFLGWTDDNGNLIQSGENVTASITAPITLTAKWEPTVTVTVNVTIDHTEDGGGYDKVDERTDVFLSLVSKSDAGAPYLETGDTLELSNRENDNKEEVTVTQYTHTFEDMPASAGYTVVTSKSGYDVKNVNATSDANGNWTIDVEMKYKPTNFDLYFTVEVDESFKAEEFYPAAAIVKVTFWSNEEKWEIITQQRDNLPGVRVDLENGRGDGSYPVWKYESTDKVPYGYRAVVTSFIYPDGTIVAVNDETQIVEWTDDVYTATLRDVPGGQLYGNFDGAYYSDTTQEQAGTLKIVINRNQYNVTFNAQGGQIKNADTYTEKNQYVVPDLDPYVPTREGGYIFGGWYTDKDCTIAATEGKDLNKDITLYAKWIAQLTIRGDVKILGTYQQNGEPVKVHDIDRATEAVVVLQENRNRKFYEVDSQKVTFKYSEDHNGTATYSFSGIPDDGKEYRIQLLLLNYGTKYDNESDQENDCSAVFGGDNVANVDAELTFVPPSYDQRLLVDATQISANFRPSKVLSEVMYRDVGDIHPFKRISQHDVTPFGVNIELEAGKGKGSQSIWKWHTDGALYDYQMNISTLYGNVPGVFSSEGTKYNSDTAPYHIIYDAPVYWDADAGAPSGELKATLVPKKYLVRFDLNAGTDTVTGMDGFKLTQQDEEDNDIYGAVHTWSIDTAITAVPQREGFRFLGWTTDGNAITGDANGNITIPADVREEVVLKALWEGTYHVQVSAVTGGTATGTADYLSGEQATVTATPDANYSFIGWYEDGTLVSTEAVYSFEVTGNRLLKAVFAESYTITTVASPAEGGIVSGGGVYGSGQEVTISAEANEGYCFVGWYDENNRLITTHTWKVVEDRTLTAKFVKKTYYHSDFVYIFGYNNSQIGATGPLLRGELAQMIYRLVRQNGTPQTNGKIFADTEGYWFQSGMAYMAQVGAIDASQTKAHPYASVSRGEAYKMICLGLGFTNDTNLRLSQYATILRGHGYEAPEGTVTSKILRWEFCKLFNEILGRSNYELIDTYGNAVTHETYQYTDLKPGDEYYEIMLIATSTFTDGRVNLYARIDRKEYDYAN